MDLEGNTWPIDGTLPQYSAQVAEGLSQAPTYPSEGSSPYLSDVSTNEGDALDLLNQAQDANRSLGGQPPDFLKVPWEDNERASSDDPLGGLPSLLDVDDLGDVGGAEIPAASLENNNRKDPGRRGNENSRAGDLSLSLPVPDSGSHDCPDEITPGPVVSNLADKLLFPTHTALESDQASVGHSTRVAPVNPFAQLALRALEPAGDKPRNGSPVCIPSGAPSYHAASPSGGNPAETEQSIPMQSDLLGSQPQVPSDSSGPAPRLAFPSGYATHAEQTDFVSVESNLSGEGSGETGEIRVDETFSLQCDPPSFSDDSSDIKSPELCADLTRISSIAQQWCSDPSGSQNDDSMSSVIFPRQREHGSEGHNQLDIPALPAGLEPTPIPGCNLEALTDNLMVQLDTDKKKENDQECGQEDLRSEIVQNSFISNFLDADRTQGVTEKSRSDVQTESVLTPRKADSHFALNSNKHLEGDTQGIRKEAEQDVPLDHTSGSSDDGHLLNIDDSSSSSVESVILLSDIELDEQDQAKRMVKLENCPAPDRACRNEALERNEPGSATDNSDDKRETEHDVTVDDLQNTDSSSNARFTFGATFRDEQYSTELSQDTCEISADRTVSCEANKDSPPRDSSDVRAKATTSSAEDQTGSQSKSTAKQTNSSTERSTAKFKLQIERSKDDSGALGKDNLKRRADVGEISDGLRDSEHQERPEVSKNRDEHREKDTTYEVLRSNQGETDTPISLCNSEESSLNEEAAKKTADGSPAVVDGPDKCPSNSENMQSKNSTSPPTETETLPEKNDAHDDDDNDDDVVIIDEDPEVISLGSSDEDEAEDNSASKQEKVAVASSRDTRSASKRKSASRATSAAAVKKLEWACHMCRERSKTLNALKLHVRRAHNLIMIHRREDMKCKLCSFTGTWQKIKEHIIHDHKTPLKWYIRNHATREILKPPLSVRAPAGSPKTSAKTAKWSPSSQPDESCKQETTPASKEHYFIKRVASIVDRQRPSTDSMPRQKQPYLRNRTVSSLLVTTSTPSPTLTSSSVNICTRSRTATSSSVNIPTRYPIVTSSSINTATRSRTVTSPSVNTLPRSQIVASPSVNTSRRHPIVTSSSVNTLTRSPLVTAPSLNTSRRSQVVTSSSVNTSTRSRTSTSSSVTTPDRRPVKASPAPPLYLISSSTKMLHINTTGPATSPGASKPNTATRATLPAVTNPVQPNPSNFIIVRREKRVAAATPVGAPGSTGGGPRLYPVFPSGALRTVTPSPVQHKLVYANTLQTVAQRSQQQSVKVSEAVAQRSGEPILCIAYPQQQVVKVPGAAGATGGSHLPYPQRGTLPTSAPQSIPNVRASQPAGQKTTQTILRVVSNPTGPGTASKTQMDMSSAKALLNAICKSSMTNTSTKVAPLPKANVAVSALQGTKSTVSLPNPTSTRKIYIPSTMSVLQTSQPAVTRPSLGGGNRSSFPVATTCKAQTVTTQSSGPLTSSEVASNISVQRTAVDGDMASYMIRVPKSRTDGSMYSVSSDGKKEDAAFYMAKVPVNRTNSPKKFMVHLPSGKDSTLKHAVCIVQPPAGRSDVTAEGSSTALTKPVASLSRQVMQPSKLECLRPSLGKIASIAPGYDKYQADDNLQHVVPLKLTKTKEDPTKKAEYLAHLQEPPVDIRLLESQFKDTKVLQAADLIKVDDRVQYECARCKETFPQLMLLRLHHIDCTVHPPSTKVLPIVHIPTALLAAFFTLSASGYSSVCAVCGVLLLGNARNVEDQQDFCSHLAKHAEPQLAITSLDDKRKLGILQTRTTSQQAKEWVDYLVPPFKMWNKPTSARDGGLEEYVCTAGILHRESVKRKGKRKRSPSPPTQKHHKHQKHKKHKKHHKSSDLEVSDGRGSRGARGQYQSSLKTAHGCEGEWIEPSPKDSCKLWTRRKSHTGGLKESIMRSPSHPKMLQHGAQADLNKTSRNGSSAASRRFPPAEISGRRSQRGLGLDFGQGLIMLPMATRRRRKMGDDAAGATVSWMETTSLRGKLTAPSSSRQHGEDVIGTRDENKKAVNKPAGREIRDKLAGEGHQSNINTDAVHKTQDLGDIVVISSDDDEDVGETKEDDIQTDDKQDSNKALDIGIGDVGEESDSKDAFSDNSSSDDEDANEQQSDVEDAGDEIEESNRRDIPLTMMALHYQRLNEEMAKGKASDSHRETRMEEYPSQARRLSDSEQKDNRTPEDREEERTAGSAQKCLTCTDDRLAVCKSPVSERDVTNTSEGLSLHSDSIRLKCSGESSNQVSELLELETFLREKKAQHNTLKLSKPSEIRLEDSTESKPEEKDDDSQDGGSELQEDVPIPLEGEAVDNLPQDNFAGECREQENCILDIGGNSPSSKPEGTTSDVLDWNLDELSNGDEIVIEGSLCSESSNQGNTVSNALEKNTSPTQTSQGASDSPDSERKHFKDSLSGIVDEQMIADIREGDDEVIDCTSAELPTGPETSEDAKSSLKDEMEILQRSSKEDSLLEGAKGDDILDYIAGDSLLDTDTNEDENLKDTGTNLHDILDYIPQGSRLNTDSREDGTPLGAPSGTQDKAVMLEAQAPRNSFPESDQGSDIATLEDGPSHPDTEETSQGSQSHIQDGRRDFVADAVAQDDDVFRSYRKESDRSGESSADETWKTQSWQAKYPEDGIVLDSSKECDIQEIVSDNDMLGEDNPGIKNLNEELGETISIEEVAEECTLHETPGEKSDQSRRLPVRKSPLDNCSVDTVTEGSSHRDRFCPENNLTEQNLSDGSQADETLGPGVCTTEDESDVNETKGRDRFFSERSLEDILGSHRKDATGGDAAGEESASSSSCPLADGVEDVFQIEDSGGLFGRGPDDGVAEENQDAGSRMDASGDDEDEDWDDIICLLDDSDDEDIPSLSPEPHPGFEAAAAPTVQCRPGLTASGSPPSQNPADQAPERIPKRRYSHHREEFRSEDEACPSKRARGGGEDQEATSNPWCLVDASEDSDGASDADTVWKREVGASVFTHEDVGQLRAGGL